eukprot:Skav213810  [mRNA]  locus=scaffold1987:452197:454521:- [translate_table: standard]
MSWSWTWRTLWPSARRRRRLARDAMDPWDAVVPDMAPAMASVASMVGCTKERDPGFEGARDVSMETPSCDRIDGWEAVHWGSFHHPAVFARWVLWPTWPINRNEADFLGGNGEAPFAELSGGKPAAESLKHMLDGSTKDSPSHREQVAHRSDRVCQELLAVEIGPRLHVAFPQVSSCHNLDAQEVDFGSKTVAVRINGLYSHHMYRDVVDIIEQDVYMADALVSQVETAVGRKKKLGFGLIIEATMGCLPSVGVPDTMGVL